VNVIIIPLKDLKLHKLRLPATTERAIIQHFLQIFSHYNPYLTLTGLSYLLLSVLFKKFITLIY